MANYVKFMRGLSTIFDKLSVKDPNTLYFIYETEDATSGRLYLGDREIICDGAGTSVAYLKDLVDVALPEDVSELIDGQVLTYDAASDKWVARDVSAVAEVLFDTNQFELTENGEWSLLDFANAPSGSRLTKSSDGKLVWDLPDGATNEDLAEQIEALNTKFNDYDTSAQVDTKIAEAVAAASHLSYKTVETTDEIDLSEDKYIYLVKNGDTYDEYMVIDGKLEAIGSLDVDLTDYATKDEVLEINTKVTNLLSSVGEINTKVTNLITKVDTTTQDHETRITALETAIDEKVDQDEYDADMADLEEFKNAMTWKSLS